MLFGTTFKGMVHAKMCLLALVLFQTRITDSLLWNKKGKNTKQIMDTLSYTESGWGLDFPNVNKSKKLMNYRKNHFEQVPK